MTESIEPPPVSDDEAIPTGAEAPSVDEGPPPTPLTEPADGVPPVLTTPDEFAEAGRSLAAGTGPIALDTERASGFRYSGRAYLVQIRRAGSGTMLIDPIDHPDALGPIAAALDGPEWILHAADQDLPCLRELNFRCAALYDTELAGRLLGIPKVNLAAMVEHFLGLGLVKGHGAADWSRRPLPADWLNYAALDVEVLIELRDAVQAALVEAGKETWAAEEFAAVLARPEPAPRPDRWRRVSKIHTIKSTRTLAAVQQLWIAREDVARRRDVAPGRILPDSAIVAAAVADPKTLDELYKLPVFGGPRQRRQAGRWMSALEAARRLPDSELPPRRPPSTGLPQVNRWEAKSPEAAARLTAVRAALTALAEEVNTPVENLLQPELVRQLCWDDVPSATPEAVATRLAVGGARPWQIHLTSPVIADALAVVPATD
ncbi:ribonuclease D [Williamsia sp. 1138]|uniref:ribonuclease D n=1 Tax=Williamsia sp. 1138 TaxID=1903117 RepID=UPI000A1150FC|nr:ribonuclease D [Williamsia sp. 1138]OZG26656.1 ribonuclease D [Williamsia sp. 1138]